MNRLSLNIIGAGKVGKTLGKLFVIHDCFEIKGVINSSKLSAQKAVEFIGAGEVCETLYDLPAADVCMIAAQDKDIENIAATLAEHPLINKTQIAFHCSGIKSSSALLALSQSQPHIKLGSVHPVMTFASPEKLLQDFKGTYCGVEGDALVFDLMRPAIEKIGGNVFKIDADKKAVYHAASVMACNYLVSLMDMAVDLYVASGLEKEEALSAMEPLVRQTINNFFSHLSAQSLTGPIARGDHETVKRHMDAIEDEKIKAVYIAMGRRTLELSKKKGDASRERLDVIESMLIK